MAPLNLTLSDTEMSKSRSDRFCGPISRKADKLSNVLLLNINRK